MKKIIVFIFLSTYLIAGSYYDKLSNDNSIKKIYLQNDIVYITSCDKYQWCKLKDINAYVKERYFIKLSKYKFKKNTLNPTFLYIKTSTNKNDLMSDKTSKDLINQIKDLKQTTQNEKKYIKKNINLGYIRVLESKKPIIKTSLVKKRNIIKKKKIKKKIIIKQSKEIKKITKQIQKKIQKKQAKINKPTPWFIDIGYGLSSMSIINNTEVVLNKEFKDNKSSIFEIGIGKYINNNIFAALSYQEEYFDGLDLKQYLLTTNYYFDYNKFEPFIGLNLGISNLKWKKYPTTNINNDNTMKSSKITYGANIGVNYILNNNFNLYLKYQYLHMGHKSYVLDKLLKHDKLSNIFMGIKYDIN